MLQLVPAVVSTLGDMFPELEAAQEDVMAIIKEEEMQFGKTLERGIKELQVDRYMMVCVFVVVFS